MRKKTLRYSYKQRVEFHRDLLAGVRKVAERIYRGEPLSDQDRNLAWGVLLDYERLCKPPSRPRGAQPKLDPEQVKTRYAELREDGKSHAEAVRELAGQFGDARDGGINPASIYAVLRQNEIYTIDAE